ncbi:hypothetical protein PCYB_112720 [Plasmodium cynomolgi strain B]|uniref:Trichohyalin-plectin-homology domain-containing protein n=1 Tax=Plasmodium cynomolgi (strain B) TaxID=1120755 RepID=K6UDV3_PLACD|nr:hypothetical protein PCYB_112720 [Plasmodium cynomolgi strain B]GAB67251.1 hypothetical protein PCYB_112720 [Plasmodium cynomolgi strain B]
MRTRPCFSLLKYSIQNYFSASKEFLSVNLELLEFIQNQDEFKNIKKLSSDESEKCEKKKKTRIIKNDKDLLKELEKQIDEKKLQKEKLNKDNMKMEEIETLYLTEIEKKQKEEERNIILKNKESALIIKNQIQENFLRKQEEERMKIIEGKLMQKQFEKNKVEELEKKKEKVEEQRALCSYILESNKKHIEGNRQKAQNIRTHLDKTVHALE